MLAASLRRAAHGLSSKIIRRDLSKLAAKITDADRAAYERDGAIVVRGAFGPEWVESLRAAAETNLSQPGPLCDEHVLPGQPGRFHDDQFLWMRHGAMRSFIHDSQAAAIARAVTGSQSVSILYDQLFVKEPGTQTTTPWHTDHSYWHLTGGKVVSLWVALDVVPGNTAVRYAAGSHKWHLKHRIKSFSGDSGRYAGSEALPVIPDIDELERKGEVKVLRWDLEPGDVICFDSYTVHGSPGNSSNSVRRRAYAMRWCSEGVTFDSRPGTMHHTWAAKGFDNKLQHGAGMECAIHPVIPTAV